MKHKVELRLQSKEMGMTELRRWPLQKVDVPEGQSGEWRVERFTVSETEARFHAIRNGGRAVRPGTYTRLIRGGKTIMSDTPAEMSDHTYFVRIATGSVLVNGLGLGMCAAAVLRKPEVTSLTVVEKSLDVIRLVAPSLSDDRLTIIEADALDWQPPKGKRYGAVWHDIWDDICADNLPDMHRLHRKYGGRADWQGSWCRAMCEYQARQDKRSWSRWA